MKRTCPKAKRTQERIECTALGSFCLHQYYKQCRGSFELTERAFSCPVAKWEEEK